MSAFSKLDFGEVTRLTKAGKLAEAMALLQGKLTSGNVQVSPGSEAPEKTGVMKRPIPPLERLVPPSVGRALTFPAALRQGAAAKSTRSISKHDLPDIPLNMQAFGAGLSGLGSLSEAKGTLRTRRQPSVPVPVGARFEERELSNDAGSRTYKVYVPSGYTGQPLPVVIMLHGCTQDPDDFAAGTCMNEVAEEETFLVAYPRQPQSANLQKCWNWFSAAEQRREGGEPSLIAGIAAQVVAEFSADSRRVYVAGLSAGGAAAAVMGATYPDVFAAVGVHSGLACGAARDMPSAFAAMSGGGAVLTRVAGRITPTIVFHGDADRTVNRINGDQVIAQATQGAALTEVLTHGVTQAGMAYTRIDHFDGAGKELFEQWVLRGGGHAWSGGSADGSYTDARGPDASREMVRFFLQHKKAPAGI